MSWSAPSGRISDSIIARTTASVRYDVTVAGFTIAGMPARKVGRQLLQHAPAGEVEGVDVDRDALERHADVPPDEGAALRQRLDVAVDVEGLVGKLAAAPAGVGEERPDAALDVDPGIALRGAGRGRDRVELVLPRHEVLRHRLEHPGALVERHRAERRPADLPARTPACP